MNANVDVVKSHNLFNDIIKTNYEINNLFDEMNKKIVNKTIVNNKKHDEFDKVVSDTKKFSNWYGEELVRRNLNKLH